jgi:hypothetical protein
MRLAMALPKTTSLPLPVMTFSTSALSRSPTAPSFGF